MAETNAQRGMHVRRFFMERPWSVLLIAIALALVVPGWGIFGAIKFALIVTVPVVACWTLSAGWRWPKKPKIGPGDAEKIAELRQRFPFLTPQAKLFTSHLMVNYTSDPPGISWGELRKLQPNSQADYHRALIVLQRSTMFERYNRGYPLFNSTNELNWPREVEDGLVIEESLNDDGSVDAVVAYDVDEPVSQTSYDKAWRELDIAGRMASWKRTMWQPFHARYINDDLMPLYKPALKTVRLVAAPSNDNPMRPPSTEKGAAQWAWFEEIAASPATSSLHRQDFRLADKTHAPGAPLGFLFRGDWTHSEPDDFSFVFAEGEGHRIIVGPTGSGKFTSAFAPLLLSADKASMFVFDVADGEAARVTAPWRRTLGPVHVIDPFDVSGEVSTSLNPLLILNADDENVLQAAKQLTDALFVVPPGNANDEFWNAQARGLLTAYLLHVATSYGETDRTLRRVRQLIRRPIDDDLIAALADNPVAGGYVQDMAANLNTAIAVQADKQTFLAAQTLLAHTDFLDLPAVQRATADSVFRPSDLRARVSTLYVCLPEQQIGPVGRWLRLVYTTVMEQVRVKDGVPLHVLIDEFPALGRFDRVKDDMALVRKFGIHMHIATISLSPLEEIYKSGWQTFMASAKYQQFLGGNDPLTLDYFSNALGMTTRRSTNTGQSRSAGGGGGHSTGEAWQAVPLQTPDELRRMNGDFSITVVQGMNPVVLRKLRYHDFEIFDARLAPKDGEPELDASEIYPESERKQEMLRMLLNLPDKED